MDFQEKYELLKTAVSFGGAVGGAMGSAAAAKAPAGLLSRMKAYTPGVPSLGWKSKAALGLGAAGALAVPLIGGPLLLGKVSDDTGLSPTAIGGLAALGALGVYRGRQNRLAEARLMKALERHGPGSKGKFLGIF